MMLARYAGVAALVVVSTACRAGTLHVDRFDQNHSTIGFEVPIADGMSLVTGKFTKFSVDLTYDSEDVRRSAVTVVIDAASVHTGIPERDDHLRSADFFDVAEHPQIRFTSTRVRRRGDDLAVSGMLEMRGVRKPIDFIGRLEGPKPGSIAGRVVVGAVATATLDRRDFGVAWEHTLRHFVGDRITVSVHLISKLIPARGSPANHAHG